MERGNNIKTRKAVKNAGYFTGKALTMAKPEDQKNTEIKNKRSN